MATARIMEMGTMRSKVSRVLWAAWDRRSNKARQSSGDKSDKAMDLESNGVITCIASFMMRNNVSLVRIIICSRSCQISPLTSNGTQHHADIETWLCNIVYYVVEHGEWL
jgi:hypothetical protein